MVWVRLQVVLAVGLAVTGGCLRPAPPKLNLARPAPAPAALDLKPYIQAARYGEWVYERAGLGAEAKALPTTYPRRVGADRLSEGVLAGRQLPPLEQYMQAERERSATTRPADGVPLPPLSPREAPQLFELDEPMEPIPLELAHTNPIVTTTAIRCYDRRGRRELTGTLTRRAQLEGTQDVDCPAGHFTDCLRVRLELQIEFPLGPTIDWNSYVWLSREAGEVRRIQEFSGGVWIFGFGGAHEFRLVSYSRGAPQTMPGDLSPKWARGLVTLDRPIPRPRISGMMVDFATARPAETE
jgi:hypothetical protein